MSGYYTIALVALLAAISPGPDFIVVAKHAVANNRLSAIMTSAGIGFGLLIHTTYCVMGLAVVISHSLLLFSLIKYCGAAYLIYLGIKSLLSKREEIHIQQAEKSSPTLWAAFQDGLLANILNPKCTLFMLSVFTLVIDPHTSRFVQASYGIEIALITLAWFIFLSYGLTTQIIKQKINSVQHIVNRFIGGVLIALGIIVIREQL